MIANPEDANLRAAATITTTPALLYVTANKPTPEHYLRICHALGEAFGPHRFDIRGPHTGAGSPDEWKRALDPVRGHLDLPGGLTVPQQHVSRARYQVRVKTSYYGPGLPAGDAPFLVSLMSWLETHLEQAECLYGADVQGIGVTAFRAKDRADLMRFFLRHGHTPWRQAVARGLPFQHAAPHCGFCGLPYRLVVTPSPLTAGYVCDGCGVGCKTNSAGERYDPWIPGEPLMGTLLKAGD